MGSKVSVIVPVYNAKQYLSQCVQSITEQTFADLELLLIDDGSTDGCSEICDRMAEKDCRIVVIHKENGGAATARNLGIDLAKGEYILFIDADDWLDAQALNHKEFRKVYRLFSLKPLRLKWKVYFFFIKHSMALPTYIMTTVILKLKTRGTA